jgi:hypothetical protein
VGTVVVVAVIPLKYTLESIGSVCYVGESEREAELYEVQRWTEAAKCALNSRPACMQG